MRKILTSVALAIACSLSFWEPSVARAQYRTKEFGSQLGLSFDTAVLEERMNSRIRRLILKANAGFLGLFGAVSFFMLDVRGIWFSSGPQAGVLRGEPASGVGFLEAHGLAVIIAIWFWRASRLENPDRAWHLTAAAVHTLLAAANISLWRIFILCDVLTLGYVSTSLHCLFAVLQLIAAAYASRKLYASS